MKNAFNTVQQAALTVAGAVLLHSTASLAPAQCCGRVSQNQPRIVGGSTAARGAYPWMTALIERGQTPQAGQFCGGALIAPQWVLTAGHCVEGTTAARLDVIVGSYNLTETNGGGQRIQVTQIISHPSFGEVNGILSNDVALLKLATPVTNVAAIRLVDSPARIAAGMPCRGMGFGTTSEDGPTSNILLQVDLSFIGLTEANQVYGGLSDAHVAAGVAGGGRDTCQGDSGGPLIVSDGSGGWMHAGVVSFGDGCARPGVPGVYASTLKYAAWINQQTGVQPPPVVTDDFGNTVAAAAAGTLGTAISGKLEAAGDIDVFKFTVTGPGTLNAASTGTTALNGQWLNSAGAALTAQTGAPNFTLGTAVTTAGSYYLAVKGAAATTTGAYGVTASFAATPPAGTPEIDLAGLNSTAIPDGDTAPTAAKGTDFGTAKAGASVSRTFTIKNTGAATLNVGTVQLSGAGAAQFAVSVQPASTVAAGRTATFTLTWSPKAAGTHVADVSFVTNDADENPTNFRITGAATADAAADDHGNTIALATIVALPGTRAGVIEKSGDVDFFKFTVAATATVTIKTTGSIDTYGTLYNATGGYLTEADDSTDLNFSIHRKLAPGVYYIAVDGYDSKVTGAYTLQIVK